MPIGVGCATDWQRFVRSALPISEMATGFRRAVLLLHDRAVLDEVGAGQLVRRDLELNAGDGEAHGYGTAGDAGAESADDNHGWHDGGRKPTPACAALGCYFRVFHGGSS